MKKVLVALVLLAAVVSPMAIGQTGGTGADAITLSGKGRINWTTGWIYAPGLAVVNPKAVNLGQARAGCVLGARKDAQRNLLEAVKGVTITSETVVQDFLTVSDKVKVTVSGMIQGAVQVGPNVYNQDATCEVTLAMPIYPNLTQAIVDNPDPIVQKKASPPPAPVQNYKYPANPPNPPPPTPPPANPPPPPIMNQPPPPPPPPPPLPPSQSEAFPAGKLKWDGLIVDGRSCGLKPALLPVIYSEGGTVVFSQNNVNDQTTIKAGITGYARDMGAAKKHYRVSADPLVVIARSAKGSKQTDPVISNSAAQYIVQTEPNSGYLRNGRVMVVF